MKKVISTFLLLGMVLCLSQTAQTQPIRTRILFVFDGSGSMFGMWENDQKINIAKKLLVNLVDSLGNIPGIEIALRAYGHQTPKAMYDCKDTKLEVPFGPSNKQQIIEKLKGIVPKGTTPIAYSLSMAANDFPSVKGVRNIIILITDGIEECKGDPCAVSIALQQRGIILKPFIIGLGINEEIASQLECAGNFFNAKKEKDFREILNVVVSNALNSTTAQVSLLDIYGKPTETDVNMTFYDAKSGMIRYNFYHTLNENGLPDTLFLDPFYKYNIVVHTMPHVEKSNIQLNPGKHNIIAIPAPQGNLDLKISGFTSYPKLQCIVRQADQCQILNIQDVNKPEKYLVGKYDLEILTVPKMFLEGVEITQDHTYTIEIDQPGKVSFFSAQNMIGSIYRMNTGTFEFICSIDPTTRSQVLIMQPGSYTIVYRRTTARITYYTNQLEFKISSGVSTAINLP
jgi:Ca-activated chloride channel homolog